MVVARAPRCALPLSEQKLTRNAAVTTDVLPSTDISTRATTLTFEDLGLDPALLADVAALGYRHPTPIQAEAIGPLIEGHDLVGQAATGTGKTAAFMLPMLQRLAERRAAGRTADDGVFGLVLAPTRELAMQVCTAAARYGEGMGVRTLAVYGGAPIGPQLGALRRGVDVVVATPGRAIDLINRGGLRLDGLEVAVLDEADEMLDMGFVEDIETILEVTAGGRQTVLFSATMPSRIESLAHAYLREPVTVRIEREPVAEGASPLVRQAAYLVPRTHTTAALGRVLELERPRSAIVFCRTRADVDAVTETLTGRGLRAEALHGGLDQEQRARVVERLRSGRTELLVATDVAARGLDIDLLTHVVNHDVPQTPEAYVHRIGRVGRAGREGTAITLVPPSKRHALRAIERLTGQPITLAAVPSVTELRAARLARTRTELVARLLGVGVEPGLEPGTSAEVASPRDAEPAPGSGTDDVRAMVAELAEQFDPVDVAAAAVRLAPELTGAAAEEEDIPRITPDAARPRSKGGPTRGPRAERGPGRGRAAGGRPKAGTTRLFVAAGRAAGVRPQDIVGALANESRLSGRDIGTIQIHERHALVEVPEAAAEDVLRELRGSTMLKGR
ncbi:MAG: DEAD/DEAH box helicase, partial [Pseudonocardia sp.]|nr:DEAD/DEAH box helicase [Pseudonocardia sp.]